MITILTTLQNNEPSKSKPPHSPESPILNRSKTGVVKIQLHSFNIRITENNFKATQLFFQPTHPQNHNDQDAQETSQQKQ